MMRPMDDSEIMRRASQIAGACWDDREKVGGLFDQLHAVADAPGLGSDGDLTDDERRELRALAAEIRRQADAAMYRLSS